VALLSGLLAGTVASAKSRTNAPARARIRVAKLPESADSCPIPARYRAAFEHAARATDLPLAMLVAVGRVESNLTPSARSRAGARGLLQVLPSTAATMRLDVDRPASNILAGARYLRLQLDRFESPDLALAAYNAGPTAVAGAGGAPSTETLHYVAKVTSIWRDLLGCG
jgi:soluble lytic murein transglycosylase-like protein